MLLHVNAAQYVHDYTVHLQFNNGVSGEIDLSACIKKYPLAHVLEDIEQFKQFKLNPLPTLQWSCGFDLSPEWLYRQVTGIDVLLDGNTLFNKINHENNAMPEIANFLGMRICMYFADSEHPPQHIHVYYNEYEAIVELKQLNIIKGELPKRCRQFVREWAELHQAELLEMWETQQFHQVAPLE
jgi:hypothetical protein